MINPIKLKPFTKFCVSLGMLPSSYKQSLTYEEQLIWFCDFLENKVIPAVNQNAEAVEEMQNLFNELQTYVNEYFSNVDVQEEINNKLDDMAESGELEEIIGVYLNANGILTFDTLNDMIISDKLVDGSVARTLGGLAFNDKNGHLYKIEHIISANPDGTNLINLGHDDLYARLILEPKIVNSLTDTDPTVNAPSVSAVNTALDELDNSKANSNDVYTKTEVDELLTGEVNQIYNLRARVILSDHIDMTSYSNIQLRVRKRNGMIFTAITLTPINIEISNTGIGYIGFFDNNDNAFTLNELYQILGSYHPKIMNISNELFGVNFASTINISYTNAQDEDVEVFNGSGIVIKNLTNPSTAITLNNFSILDNYTAMATNP